MLRFMPLTIHRGSARFFPPARGGHDHSRVQKSALHGIGLMNASCSGCSLPPFETFDCGELPAMARPTGVTQDV